MEINGPWQVEEVVDYHRERNDQRLTNFRPVNACKDVDAVGGKGREHGHIDVIEGS
jgi:hypothetical protein